MRFSIIGSIITVFICISRVSAQEVQFIDATLIKSARDVEIRGDYAYCVFADEFQVLDISAPQNPYLLGRLFLGVPSPSQDDWHDLSISGNYAYIAHNWLGLQIVDISDPNLPRIESNYGSGVMMVRKIDIHDDKAYILFNPIDGPLQIGILSLTIPNSPIFVNSFDASNPRDFFILGDYAYALHWGLLLVFDISDPENPLLAGSFSPLDRYLYTLAVVGQFAYLAGNIASFTVMNVQDPSNIYQVGSCPAYGYNLLISDSLVFLSDGVYGFEILNIATPDNPVIIYQNDTLGIRGKFDVAGNTMIAADRNFKNYDISNPLQPQFLSSYGDGTSWIQDFDIVGDMVFICDNGLNMRIFDLTDPLNPEFLTETDVQYGYIHSAAFEGDSALVISLISFDEYPASFFYVVDFHNIYTPVKRLFWDTDGEFAAEGFRSLGYYISTYWRYPAVYAGVDEYRLPEYAKELAIDGDFIYIADGTEGFLLLQYRDRFFSLISQVDTTNNDVTSVAVRGNYAYTIDNNYGLQIFEISNPAYPELVGQYDSLSSNLTQVLVRDNYAFVSGNGIFVFDVANPNNPLLLAQTTEFPSSGKLALYSDYIYQINPNSIQIYRFSPTGVTDGGIRGPSNHHMIRAFPNPFNNSVTMDFSSQNPAKCTIDIYNITGQLVRTINVPEGTKAIIWDGKDNAGANVNSGVYFARVKSAAGTLSKKMVLLR